MYSQNFKKFIKKGTASDLSHWQYLFRVLLGPDRNFIWEKSRCQIAETALSIMGSPAK